MKEYIYQMFLNGPFKEKYNPSNTKIFQQFIKDSFGLTWRKSSYLEGERLHFLRGSLDKLKAFVEAAGEEWNEAQLYESVHIDESFDRTTPLEQICHSIGQQLNDILKGRRKIEYKTSILKKYTFKEKAVFFDDEILSTLFSLEDLNRIGFYIHIHEEFCYAFRESPDCAWLLLKLPFQPFLRMTPEENKGHYTIKGVTYVLGNELFNYDNMDIYHHIHAQVGFKNILDPKKHNAKVTDTLTAQEYILNHFIKEARKNLREATGEYNYRLKNNIEQNRDYYHSRMEYYQKRVDNYKALKTAKMNPRDGWYKLDE